MYLNLEYVNSSMTNNALYKELTDLDKLVMNNLQSPEFPKVFELPPKSVMTAFRITNGKHLMKAVVEME